MDWRNREELKDEESTEQSVETAAFKVKKHNVGKDGTKIATEIKHFSHEHDLKLSDEVQNNKICNGCVRAIHPPFYSCGKCSFFLHKSCVELPRRKQHPLHQHLLTLFITNIRQFCRGCQQDYNGFSYSCDQRGCWFDLDVQCSLMSDILTHEGHEHRLILSNTPYEQPCNGCDSKSYNVFRCTTCEFALDFRCATLPLTARYEQHEHPFILSYTAEDDSGEYYCDICEEERNPKQLVLLLCRLQFSSSSQMYWRISGSAVAVGAKLVDFVLGTDTRGSIRVPASYCGILGFSLHMMPCTAGVIPLVQSFEDCGFSLTSHDHVFLLVSSCESCMHQPFVSTLWGVHVWAFIITYESEFKHPEVNIPLGFYDNLHVSISLLAKHGSDEYLLNLVESTLYDTLKEEVDIVEKIENKHFGTPKNPCVPDQLPGGSSGGSAVAVGAQLVDFSIGTDTGGSVRVPASYCGILGFWPSHDAISTAGVIPSAQSFDTVGEWISTIKPDLVPGMSVTLFDVEGYVTGFGNPEWAKTHPAATSTAPAVLALLRGGATCIGKTVMDEMAYWTTFLAVCMEKTNIMAHLEIHACLIGYLGGSSSGSAVAVGAKLVDFALGTDTRASVRVPASYCGILGFQPSHDVISTAGVIPMSQSFDTVGWFARDPVILNRAGRVLLQLPYVDPVKPSQIIIAEDCFQLSTIPSDRLAEPLFKSVNKLFGGDLVKHAILGDYVKEKVPSLKQFMTKENADQEYNIPSLAALSSAMRLLQRYEFKNNHGEWVSTVKPDLGPGISERTWEALRTTDENVDVCHSAKTELHAALNALLGVSIPLGLYDNLPVSISLLAKHGSDGFLLNLVEILYDTLQEEVGIAEKKGH
uniref:Phorbol-ester/DAG-type domain-containing protein n=1 Tax=Fagus sylvatica TaxID=28930 RepID=A0A2N9H459_FAGSY